MTPFWHLIQVTCVLIKYVSLKINIVIIVLSLWSSIDETISLSIWFIVCSKIMNVTLVHIEG